MDVISNHLSSRAVELGSWAEQPPPIYVEGGLRSLCIVQTASASLCKDFLSLQSGPRCSSQHFLVFNGQANSAINPFWYKTSNFCFKLHLGANGSLIPADRWHSQNYDEMYLITSYCQVQLKDGEICSSPLKQCGGAFRSWYLQSKNWTLMFGQGWSTMKQRREACLRDPCSVNLDMPSTSQPLCLDSQDWIWLSILHSSAIMQYNSCILPPACIWTPFKQKFCWFLCVLALLLNKTKQ